MKRTYLLAFASIFALTGCVSRISNEEALKRVGEIEKHIVKDSDFYKTKLTAKRFEEFTYTNSATAEKSYVKQESEWKIEIFKKEKFIHYVSKAHAKLYTDFDRDRDSESEAKEDIEIWCYIQNKNYYFVENRVTINYTESKRWTSKTYSIIKDDDATMFFNNSLSNNIDLIKDFVGDATSKSYLKVAKVAFGNSKEKAEKSYKFSPYSGGEGSLKIKGSYRPGYMKNEDALIKTDDYKIRIKVEWVNSMINSISHKESGSATYKTETIKNLNKLNVSLSSKVSNDYPDLTGYKKV